MDNLRLGPRNLGLKHPLVDLTFGIKMNPSLKIGCKHRSFSLSEDCQDLAG